VEWFEETAVKEWDSAVKPGIVVIVIDSGSSKSFIEERF
jgi:hypothetical protein